MVVEEEEEKRVEEEEGVVVVEEEDLCVGCEVVGEEIRDWGCGLGWGGLRWLGVC